MKKYLFTSLILFSLLITPAFAELSVTDYIAQLQAQIKSLTAQLNQLLAQQNHNGFCYDFKNNIGPGQSTSDVLRLRQFLDRENLSTKLGSADDSITVPPQTARALDQLTVQAVKEFQAKYGIPQTGFVGPLTRGQLNKLYSCQNNKPVMCPADMRQCPNGTAVSRSGSNCEFVCLDTAINKAPVISSISGPTTINVGETGTWTIQASDPENKNLSYYIDWGDVVYRNQATLVAGVPLDSAFVQTSTFTHQYSNSGTYTISISVRDDRNAVTKSTLTVQVGNANTISVVAPNNGEIWNIGDVQQIKWSNNFTTNTVDLYLVYPFIDCANCGAPLGPILLDRNINNNAIYNWIVGTDVNNNPIRAGKYSVRVCTNYLGFDRCDDSDSYITLKSAI